MKILLTLLLIFTFVSVPRASAHSGRTDAFGGHNCYVGACAGTYHHHNGGYSSGYSAPAYTPPASPTPIPAILSVQATMANDYNSITKEFSIKFDWTDVLNSQGYSVSISKFPGSNPGPIIDTFNSVWRFNHLKTGKWYLNLKSKDSYFWSQVVSWPVDLPNNETRKVK